MSIVSSTDDLDASEAWARMAADGWGRGSLADWPRRPLLEEALATHVRSLGRRPLESSRLEAVLARLGLQGRPPLTLAEAGRSAGVSGERVRQLEARLRKQHAGVTFPLPQLDAALAAVRRALPLPAERVPDLLQRYGLTAGPFSVESLISAARLLGRKAPFAVSGGGPDAMLLPASAASAAAHAGVIRARARRQVERTGASTIEALATELVGEGVVVRPGDLRLVLETCADATVCPDSWFWFPRAADDGAFLRSSRRMLAVTSPLPVDSLYDGLRRHYAFRRRPAPPPVPVLAAVYADHPAFEIDDGVVSSAEPIDPEVVGEVNQRIVDILRESPGQMLARAPLLDACHRAGLNLTSVNLYTTYSECLERVRPGVFAVRGTVAGTELAPATRPRRRSGDAPTCGWTDDGRPWLSAPVSASTSANGVVHVPAEIRTVLVDRRFACFADGVEVASVAVDRHGNSWGWTRYLRHVAASPGDVLSATFDPDTGTATVEVRRRQR